MNFPHLFSPGKIGNVTLKNRIVQGPTELLAAGFNGEVSEDYIRHYELCAKAGAGLIIPAYASVDDEFSQSFAGAQLKVTDRKHGTALSKLARRVHKYDAKVMIQCYMAGRQAVPTKITGKRIIAPSPLGYSWHDQIPEEMTIEDIKNTVMKFGRAAVILRDSGIDGMEVLAAGGYLINEFLSPKSNIRTDEYGGSFENRTRIVKEIVEEIRKQVGNDLMLSVRFSADEFLEGGYDLEEGIKLAKFFEEIGFDCININNSNQEKRYYIIEPVGFKTGWKTYIIKAIKAAVTIPVLSTNVIKKPEQAEEMLAEGIMDFVVFARAFMADPEWIIKAKEGRSDEIKVCIGCLYCLEQTGRYIKSICAVNPKLARLDEFPDHGKDLEGKKIIVVGAGPSGLEAAIECEERGAKVTIYEKKDFIGGSLALGAIPPDKEPLQWLVDYYNTMLKKLGIEVKLSTEVVKDQIISEKPYAVFVATGATPVILPCALPDGKRVFTVEQALGQDVKFNGEKVVVIGGGMTGLEVAEHYALMGNAVTLVEMRDKLAPEVDPDNVVTVVKHLDEAKASILMSHRLVALDADGVVVEQVNTGETLTVPADRIILSLGGRPNNALYLELAEKLENVIAIGDTSKVGRVAGAVQSGFEHAYVLE